MRIPLLSCILLGVVTTSCDRIASFRDAPEADPPLSLSLEMSDVLDWGGVSAVRLTLTNQGDVPASDVDVELYFPSWLSFSSVEPSNTEVSLLSTGGETRLTYGLGDPPLQPGETRTIVQNVRVPPQGAADVSGTVTGDTAGDASLARNVAGDTAAADTSPMTPAAVTDTAPESGESVPANRTLRARLVWDDGDQVGAEVRTLMPFRGADNSAALPTAAAPAEARIESEGVGPVRLGAALADLRAAAPGARDTSFTTGGTSGGAQRDSGLVVPLGNGRSVLVSLQNQGVERIIVREAGVQTDLGHGVGSTFQQLRQAYGNHCTTALPGGRIAVRFTNLRGVGFVFDAPAAATRDTAAATAAPATVPDGAQVREIQVQRGESGC